MRGFKQDPVDRFNGLSLHESICANKTVTCRYCGEYVMCRFLSEHYLTHHHIARKDDLIQSPVVNDSRSVLCEVCGYRQQSVTDFCLVTMS